MLTTEPTARHVSIPTSDGLTLFSRHWARSNPRGVVVVSHGFGEHGGCYDHVASRLGTSLDLDTVAPDFRGHGRSPGRRGVVRRYEDLLTDLTAVFDWAGDERPGLPRFVLGHSNGGQLSLRLALDARSGPCIAGLILSNPALRVASRVPRYKLSLGRFLLKHAPGVTLSARIAANRLTRDPSMQRLHRVDRLRHARMSAPFFFGMAEGGHLIAERAVDVTVPLLMLLGGDDPVIDAGFSSKVFERIGSKDKTLRLYPRMLHEPLNELGREQVFEDVVAWLDARLPSR